MKFATFYRCPMKQFDRDRDASQKNKHPLLDTFKFHNHK